jgi:hypothetical protein
MDLSSHDTPENLLSRLQLRDLILQTLSLVDRSHRLRRNRLSLRIGQTTDHHGRENLLQAADDVAFDNLGGDVRDECLLRNLRKELRYGLLKRKNGSSE